MNLTINATTNINKSCAKPKNFGAIRKCDTSGLSPNAKKVLDLVMESAPFRKMEKKGNIDILSRYNCLLVFYRGKAVAQQDFGARVYSSTIPAKAKDFIAQLDNK